MRSCHVLSWCNGLQSPLWSTHKDHYYYYNSVCLIVGIIYSYGLINMYYVNELLGLLSDLEIRHLLVLSCYLLPRYITDIPHWTLRVRKLCSTWTQSDKMCKLHEYVIRLANRLEVRFVVLSMPWIFCLWPSWSDQLATVTSPIWRLSIG